ncbi:PAS domain S-box protein [Candidatus Omnitrophota bacterium]
MSEPKRKKHSYEIRSPRDSTRKKAFSTLSLTNKKPMDETYRVLERAVEQSIDGIAMAGMDGVIQFCNQTWAAMHGYEAHELIGQNLHIFHTKEQMRKDVIPFNEQVKKKGYFQGEVGHVRKDGTTFSTWMTTTFLKDEHGNPIGLVGIARDITDSKHIEKALFESEWKYRMTIDSMADAIHVVDQDLRFILFNAAFKRWAEQLGLETNVIGKTIFEVFSFLPESVKDEYQKVFETGKILATEEFDRVGERDFITETRKIPIIEHGKVTKVVTVVSDITARKKMDERLSSINKCLLSFGPKPNENINRLVALCGKAMGGLCALYNRLDDGMLCSVGSWNTPSGFNPIQKPEGHICYDVIKRGHGKFWIVRNLPETSYAKTDSNVKKLKLKTYIGIPVCFQDACVGTLCVVYQKEYIPTNDDKKFMQIVASAIAVEEKRSHSEGKLRHSEEKYKTLTENVNVGLYRTTVGAGGKFIEANPAIIKMFGYKSKKEFFLKSVCDLYQNQAERARVNKELLIKGFVRNKEIGLKKKDGATFLGLISAVAVKDSDGAAQYFDGIVEDITERKQAEQALRESEERFRQFFENEPEYCYMVGLDGKLIDINSAALSALGYKKQEIIGKPFLTTIYAPSARKKAEEIFLKWHKTGKVTDEEITIVTKQGQERMVLLSVDAVRGADKKILYSVSVQKDITERKKSEEKVRRSEERYRFLFEKSPVFSVIIGVDQKVRDINKWTIDNFGYSKEQVVGKDALDFVVTEDKKKAALELEKTFSAGITGDLEVNVRAKDGSIHTILFSPGQVLIREMGELTGALISGVDITERKKAEQRQVAMTTGLRAVVAAADELIACADVDTVFRSAVELARSKLGIERCAIFLEEGGFVHGIYGTDRFGRTTDEHANRFIKTESWKKRLRMLHPKDPNWVVVKEPRREWDGEKTIEMSQGWVVITPIQSDQRPIGVFVNDAAISSKDLDPLQQDTLAVFCSLLGNIIERKRAENKLEVVNKRLLQSNKRLKHLALRDSHTGLYNHRHLEEALEAEFDRAKRYAYSLSVIMLDLDYFKSINDVYGHQFGDVILKQFSRQLKRLVRKYDIVIRFGGEEFIIISPGVDRFTATLLARRILNVTSLSNFGDQEQNIKIKLTVAVSSYPEDKIGKSMDLVNLVDQILNKAKEDGGDRVYSTQNISQEQVLAFDETEKSTDVNYLQDKISKLTKRANQSLIEAIFAFAKTIKLKDNYTGEHVENTVFYATEIARKLRLSQAQIERIRQASKLHDLGKIGISEKILGKRSKLTKKEFEEIKKHTLIGADILRPIHFLHDIIPFILYHHERWDGKGYPFGLKRDEIPVGARIVAVADTYQALISDRPYRKAFPRRRAKEMIHQGAGTQFDPKIVEKFLSLV